MGDEQVKRLPWVDIAKGICIILVVMMHATLGVQKVMGETGFMDAVFGSFHKPALETLC